MTGLELRQIRDEFEDFLASTGKMSDEQIELWSGIDKLTDVERIILFLYAEMGSQRKLAEALHTSRTTVIKIMEQIRGKILKNGDDKSDTDSDNLGACD